MKWYVDRGLDQFCDQLRAKHPGIVIGTIGDPAHAARESDHNPEADGSVDAADPMIGKTFTKSRAEEVFQALLRNRDKRIAYFIFDRRIVSSTIEPWKVRPYTKDDPHTGHMHLSVNDKHENDASPWILSERPTVFVNITGSLPLMHQGDTDAQLGRWWVHRVQRILEIRDDGVYGPETAAAVRKLMKGGDGKTIGQREWAWLLALEPPVK